jgi:Zn-dependent protease with chaperone function
MTLAMFLAEAAAQAAPVKGVAAVANNFQLALLAFKSGGWIVALIGAAAMVGRLLVDEAADASWQRSLRHVLAAAIFAVIAYFVMFQWELSALYKAIIQGLCGAVAPELVDWISSNIRKKLGFKDKQRTPAWKTLFSRKPKPKRRRRAAAAARRVRPALGRRDGHADVVARGRGRRSAGVGVSTGGQRPRQGPASRRNHGRRHHP